MLLEAARREIRIASMGTDLLDLYAEVNRIVPIRDRRWVVEHISTLTAGEIASLRDLGVVVTTHTNRYLFKERSEEHTSELQSPCNLVCRLLLEKKKKIKNN